MDLLRYNSIQRLTHLYNNIEDTNITFNVNYLSQSDFSTEVAFPRDSSITIPLKTSINC